MWYGTVPSITCVAVGFKGVVFFCKSVAWGGWYEKNSLFLMVLEWNAVTACFMFVLVRIGTGLVQTARNKKGVQLKNELNALNCWCRDQESNQGHTDFQCVKVKIFTLTMGKKE